MAEFKRRFAEIAAQVRYAGERIVVTRRNTPMAALVGLDDLRRIEAAEVSGPTSTQGLLAAIGAWSEYDDLDRVVEAIYRARKLAEDRPMSFPR